MRTTNGKYSKASAENSKKLSKGNRKNKKTNKIIKAASFVLSVAVAAAMLILPTTTLAPDVNAFEDSKAASYSVGDIDAFASRITDNCVPETTAETTQATTAEPTTEATKPTEKATEETQPTTETPTEQEATEPVKEEEAETVKEVSYSYSSGSYLVDISNPDPNYSPSPVALSDYDRAKLERLVMGEAGGMGYTGCALVAQTIRDSMNKSGTSSIDSIIAEYKYYASTSIEPNQTVKDAVSYIFDQNGSAVQHRILCFYTGTSSWHETQEFIVGCGNVRFFDYK